MANVVNGNTLYIDSTGTAVTQKDVFITHVTLTATSASAVLLLRDLTTAANKADLRVATSGATEVFDFSDNPMRFPNGIVVQTLTNCVATCHLARAIS
jgi:hypothetical protein